MLMAQPERVKLLMADVLDSAAMFFSGEWLPPRTLSADKVRSDRRHEARAPSANRARRSAMTMGHALNLPSFARSTRFRR